MSKADLSNYRTLCDIIKINDDLGLNTDREKSKKSQIETAVATLPDNLRQIILLRYFMGLSWANISLRIYVSRTNLFRLHNKALVLLQSSVK